MALVFLVLSAIFAVIGIVFGILVIVAAFRAEGARGLLVLICPPYAVYWGLARFRHARRGLIVGVWLGSAVLSWVMLGLTLLTLGDGLAWA